MHLLMAHDGAILRKAAQALAKSHGWSLHDHEGWWFDDWTPRNKHGMERRCLVLLPDIREGVISVYLACYHPGLHKRSAPPPAPLHEPFTVTVTGRHHTWIAGALDAELHAILDIEHATGLTRTAA